MISRSRHDSILRLRGLGLRAAWSRGGAGDEVVALDRSRCEDDFRIDPERGVVVVASARGVTGAQGRPGAVLAVWSVVGEAGGPARTGAEDPLEAGLRRAHAAVERLTWSWRGAIRPTASAAAMLLRGDELRFAHVGTVRVSRLTASGVVALTRDHSLGNELAAEGLAAPPALVWAPTRSLGGGKFYCDHASVPARDGEWFLIASASLHRALPDDAIARALELSRPSAPDPEGLETRCFALLDRLRSATDDVSAAFAIVGATTDPRPWPRPAIGGSQRPPEGWLFMPGRALPDPPPGWRPETGSTGPDRRWFEEIADPLRNL